MTTDDDVDDSLVDEVASVMANMNPDERAEFARLLRLTPAELDRIIARWKADRVQ
jgi:hypothetical protein